MDLPQTNGQGPVLFDDKSTKTWNPINQPINQSINEYVCGSEDLVSLPADPTVANDMKDMKWNGMEWNERRRERPQNFCACEE